MQSAGSIAFDPWTSSAAEALKAHERYSGEGPGPLAQHQAALEVAAARAACLGPDGGCRVLHCLALCLANRLMPPAWLADAFVGRHARVVEAEEGFGTWDATFGAPWPPRTRLDAVRRRKRLKRLVHAAVWDAVMDHGAAVDRILFEHIAERPDVPVAGSTCERIYYNEALAEGLPNPVSVRAALGGNPQLTAENVGEQIEASPGP